MKNLQQLTTELEKAKHNVVRLLENENWLVDMHGLGYRADRVEKLRNEIKSNL